MEIVEMSVGFGAHRGFFFVFIYMWIRDVCRKSIYVKLFVHSIGLISMILGLFLLVSTLPSMTSIMGVFLGLFGLVLFFTPFSLEID
jgi:hypothetical protein